jgi:acyl carrier protein
MKTKRERQGYVQAMVEEVVLGRVKAADVLPHARLIDDRKLDSLDYASVLLATETWLGVRASEDDVDWSALATVDQLCDFLARSQRG